MISNYIYICTHTPNHPGVEYGNINPNPNGNGNMLIIPYSIFH